MYPQHSSVTDGRLAIGGCDAAELAREFGTPAFIVAQDDLRARAQAWQRALATHHGPRGAVVFASKAFPASAVLRTFAEEGLHVDCASGGELHLALHAGFDPAKVVLHGNAKSEVELHEAVAAGVGTIVLDGGDPERLERIVPPGARQRVLIRVTPGVHADTHAHIMTGHADSKFGYSPARAREIAERDWERLEIAGLHFHLGSQLFDASPFAAAMDAFTGLPPMTTYDVGGGMGAPYTRKDPVPDPDAWVEGLCAVAHAALGRDVELLIEPGRALVANAAVTLYSVEDVKRVRADLAFVAVDGGMSDNLRPMLYDAVYEADLAERMGDGESFTVVGKHCESSDVLVREASLIDPRPGDVLVTPVTGAYGHAMASNYNGVPRAPVVFAADGSARLVVRRETYEDLTARDA